MSSRTLVVWTEHETVTVIVRAYEILGRTKLSIANLFTQAQRETLRPDRQRKIGNPGSIGDYVITLWRELCMWPEDKAESYVKAWNAKKIMASHEQRRRGRAAVVNPPAAPQLPTFGWEYETPPVQGAEEPDVDHEALRKQAMEEVNKEKDSADTWTAPPPPEPKTVAAAEPPAPPPEPVAAPAPVAAPQQASALIEDTTRTVFVGALRDYVRALIQRDLDQAVREVAHEIGESMIKPLLRPILSSVVQDEVMPLVTETVSNGLNNALTEVSATMRAELDALTDPTPKTATEKVSAKAVTTPKEEMPSHHIIVFGLQPDEYLRAISVIQPYRSIRDITVVHAKDLRDVHHHLRPTSKLIHMIKMSAHLSSEIREKVARVYPVDGGISGARKVLLDIVIGTNLMPSY